MINIEGVSLRFFMRNSSNNFSTIKNQLGSIASNIDVSEPEQYMSERQQNWWYVMTK